MEVPDREQVFIFPCFPPFVNSLPLGQNSDSGYERSSPLGLLWTPAGGDGRIPGACRPGRARARRRSRKGHGAVVGVAGLTSLRPEGVRLLRCDTFDVTPTDRPTAYRDRAACSCTLQRDHARGREGVLSGEGWSL